MPQRINDETAFRIYQLMLGGIDEKQPLRLATLAGLDDSRLATRDYLGFVFNYAHRRWGGPRWDDPTDAVWIDKSAVDATTHRLPDGKTIVCGNCARVCRSVPCWHCNDKGIPPKWDARRERLPAFGFYRTHGHTPTAGLQTTHQRQYSGSTHDGRY